MRRTEQNAAKKSANSIPIQRIKIALKYNTRLHEYDTGRTQEKKNTQSQTQIHSTQAQARIYRKKRNNSLLLS